MDFVKKVNCTYTYGVFTHLDELTACNFLDDDNYKASDAEEITRRYTVEFEKAVSESGKGEVFFVDTWTAKNEVTLY